MCRLHANSAREAVTKMCTLPVLAGENVGSRFVEQTQSRLQHRYGHPSSRIRRGASHRGLFSPVPSVALADCVRADVHAASAV